jgi:hypothetical protein
MTLSGDLPAAGSAPPAAGRRDRTARLRRRVRAEVGRAGAVARIPVSRVNPEPRFILGNQRSGTTAVAALLAEATGESAALDLSREVFDPQFDRLRSGTLGLDEHVGRNRFSYSRTIIKEPHLTPFVDDLRARFPHGRFAVVVREPGDNLRSLFDYLEVAGDAGRAAFASARRYRTFKSWRLVVDGDWLGLEGETPLEQMAQRWNLCADAYLRYPDTTVLLRYEDFVADRQAATRALAEGLGLFALPGWGAVAASRSFQPAGVHRDRPPEDFFGPEAIAVIDRICGERMAALGYPRRRG